MSDTCDKNKMVSSELVELGIALHKVLVEEWRFAKNVETGEVIGFNKSFTEVRGAASSEYPANILVRTNDVVEGPLYFNFKFYSGASDNKIWYSSNEPVHYSLEPSACLYMLASGSDVVYEYKTANGEVVRVNRKSLDEKGLPPGALNIKWRKIKE